MIRPRSVIFAILLFTIALSVTLLILLKNEPNKQKDPKTKQDPDNPCDRDCTGPDHQPLTCLFSLVARDQFTDDPRRLADGRNRSVLTYNDQLPGPVLVVCEDDIVVVILENQIKNGLEEGADGSTTLHLHGVRQVGRTDQNEEVFGPWADGVPFVTQCPVHSGQKFNYTFKATKENLNAPPGTYFYHSHVGSQRTNGLAGVLVIKPRTAYTFLEEQIVDDPIKYTMAIQEWFESPTIRHLVSIIVNGKGKIHPQINESQTFYEVLDLDSSLRKYRFRILGTIANNFPIRVSIDNVKFAAISSDSLDIEPVQNVSFLWIAAGERYDIIPDFPRDSPAEAIKMRFIGYTHLGDSSTALCSIAWLRFPGSKVDVSYTAAKDCSDFPDHDNVFPTNSRVLNPPPVPGQFFFKLDDPYSDLTQTGNIFPISLLSRVNQEVWIPEAERDDTREFIEFDRVQSFNGIRTKFPRTPYLFQDPELNIEKCNNSNKGFYNSSDGFAFCQHVLNFPFSDTKWPDTRRSWQELVLINPNTGGSAHPIHKHGGGFWVVGEGQFEQSVEINRDFIINNFESLKQSVTNENMTTIWRYPDAGYKEDKPRNSFIISKDIIQVPNKGYVVVRIHLDNPGTFMFHCHIDSHLSHGMALGKNLKLLPFLGLGLKILFCSYDLLFSVMQIGEFSDWNIINLNDPTLSSKNIKCKR